MALHGISLTEKWVARGVVLVLDGERPLEAHLGRGPGGRRVGVTLVLRRDEAAGDRMCSRSAWRVPAAAVRFILAIVEQSRRGITTVEVDGLGALERRPDEGSANVLRVVGGSLDGLPVIV